MNRFSALLCAAGILLAAGCSLAPHPSPQSSAPSAGGKYQFFTNGGVVFRGDTETGELASYSSETWVSLPLERLGGEFGARGGELGTPDRLSPAIFTEQLPARPAPAALDPAQGKLRIISLIDGSDFVKIRGNQIWFEHRGWQLPGKTQDFASGPADEPTLLNAFEWKPVWNGNLSEPLAGRIPALPARSAEIKLNPHQARGAASIVEQPSAANDFTLTLLLDDDAAGGAEWYDVTLDW